MKINLLNDLLPTDWPEFSVQKILNAKVIWADYESMSVHQNAQALAEIDKGILAENAYAISSTPCFAGVDFDLTNSKTLVAERYGGRGIGLNGGGGRCGNTAHYQLKGIGATCMVGDHDDHVHKYGGLDAPLAILETIYTQMLNKLLPLGAVKIQSLIFVGEETGFDTQTKKPCWGVIMVREKCIRPAHLLRTTEFKPQPEFAKSLPSDVARIRGLYKRLDAEFENHNQFIMLLGKFLQQCANQFGFAVAARLMHSTLSPSNISMDGRWLDVPFASLLNSGVNYSIQSCFYDEHYQVTGYVSEILRSYGKYNNVTLNVTPLINYYQEQVFAYFEHYMGFVLGFDLALVEKLKDDKWKQVTNIFKKIINSATHIEMRSIEPDSGDPVHALIKALFLSLHSQEAAANYFKTAKLSENDVALATTAFQHIIHSAHEAWININPAENQHFASYKYFVVGSALFALKRAFLSEAFYLPAVDGVVRKLCNEKTPDDIAPLIDSYSEISNWIFEPVQPEICLFKSPKFQIHYCQKFGQYRLINNNRSSTFKYYTELYFAIHKINPSFFTINEFSFYSYFDRLVAVIPYLECSSYRKVTSND
jgi:hypothetical protein